MFAASDSLEAINPLIISLRIVGLCPYILDKPRRKFIIYQKCCLLHTAKLFLILGIVIAGSQEGLYRTYSNTLELGLDYGINYGNLTFTLLTYVVMNKFFKQIIAVLKKCLDIDAELDTLSPLKMDHETTKKSIIIHIVINYIITFIFFLCHCLLIASKLSYASMLRSLSYVVGILVSAAFESLLFTMLRELRRRYTNINGILLYIQRGNLDADDAFERLEMIKRIYRRLANLRITVGIFSFQILIKYFMSYTAVLVSLFFMISWNDDEWQSYMGLLVWSGMSILELIGFTYYYDNALQETRKSAIYYENVVEIYDPNYTKRSCFYSQAKFETDMFSVCDLFYINWNFLLVMLGSIISNLVVLIQFKAVAERNK